jgi:hypothetical protein
VSSILIQVFFYPDQLTLTLPNEGEEDYEINQHILAVIRAGKLSQHINAYILVCAKHLLRTISFENRHKQRKMIYKRYAQMIVRQHPCLADHNSEENYVILITIFLNLLFYYYWFTGYCET